MRIFRIMKTLVLALPALGLLAGCEESLEEGLGTNYGYAQIHFVKQSTLAGGEDTPSESLTEAGTKASDGNALDYLSDAKKLRLTLRAGSGIVYQTVTLEPTASDQGEWGMWSEKFQLYAGSYEIVNYEALGVQDVSLYSTAVDPAVSFDVVPNGLEVVDLGADVVPRGYISFEVVKDFQIQMPESKAGDYRLDKVTKADVMIRNLSTLEETAIDDIDAAIQYYYTEGEDGKTIVSSKVVCDTTAYLEAGDYKVVSFTLWNRSTVLEANRNPNEDMSLFTVKDNEKTVAYLPVTFTNDVSLNVMDGIYLKKIWEKLDGPNWSYRGQVQDAGANWNFDRDMDLWTAQPGVLVREDGRVSSISLSGFGAKGDLPAEIGNLTALKSLTIGNTDDSWATDPVQAAPSDVLEYREYFKEMVTPAYGLSTFAPEMYSTFPADKQARIKASAERGDKVAALDVYADNPDNYSNGVTSICPELANCTELTGLYIANGLVSELPDELSQLENLTDMMVFNCRRMTRFPDVLAEMPSLQMLYFANNKNIPADELERGLAEMADPANPVSRSIQGIYFMNNRLETIPDLSGMEKISLLDFQSNNIYTIAAPFGKEHNLTTFNVSNNHISSIPVDEEGVFAGAEAVETWSFANNLLTEVPDIFDSDSPYLMGTLDLSQNRITGFAGDDGKGGGTYKGMNVEILNLSFNDLDSLSRCLMASNSMVSYLQLRGNGMKKIGDGALVGENSYLISALGLAYNRLKELPSDFSMRNLPYLSGVDFTANAFESYPAPAMGFTGIQTMIMRAQRDDNGFRCFTEWPVGVYASGLSVLYLGSNDIGKVQDGTLEKIRFQIELTDNPNLNIDLSTLCPYIMSGQAYILVDESQSGVVGCDILFQ